MKLIFIYVLMGCLLLIASHGFSQTAATGETEPSAVESQKLVESLSQALEEEEAGLANLIKEHERVKNLLDTLNREVDSLKLTLSTYASMMSVPSTSLEDLEKARDNLRATLADLSERLKEIKEKQQETENMIAGVLEQKNLNEQALKDLKLKGEKNTLHKTIVANMNNLLEALKKREKILQKQRVSCLSFLEQIQKVMFQAESMLEDLEGGISKRKKEVFFQKKENIFTFLTKENLSEEIKNVTGNFSNIAHKHYRDVFLRSFNRLNYVATGIFLGLLIILESFLIHLKRQLTAKNLLDRLESRKPYLYRAMIFIASSFTLTGIFIFAHIYFHLNKMYAGLPIVNLFLSLVTIWLFTKWFLDFIRIYCSFIPLLKHESLAKFLKLFVKSVRWFMIIYAFLKDILELGGLLILYRFLMEGFLLSEAVFFWRTQKKTHQDNNEGNKLIGKGLMVVSYLALGGALIVELLGYPYFAFFWLSGWASSSIVLLWSYIIGMVLWEWEDVLCKKLAVVDDGSPQSRGSLSWLVIRLLWTLYGILLIVAVLIAWGAKKPVILAFFKILNTPVSIGNFNFRILGLIYGAITIGVTNIITKKLRTLLKNKLFRLSGLEEGIQESAISIIIYAVWFAGIIVALNMLGFSGTSLALAFGALSIGLGFGLQNIFNNFVSGIILLLERPIQVGDIVEINNVWGRVKKINFRATVIQTFEEASLIIPNSEFISGKVVNWSFKDRRIRKSIIIGVSYGSDLELVRKTLIEAATMDQRVLNNPEPDVLFKDFGDSAIIFELRFWTLLDHYLQAETQIRFNIDKLFKERDIEIPFPQRDIHLKLG